MTHLTAQRLALGEMAADGSALEVEIADTDGAVHRLTLAFDQVAWLTRALMSASNELYERRQGTGETLVDAGLAPAMIAEAVQINVDATGQSALVQIAGRQASDAPLGAGSFRIDGADRLRAFATKCLEAADEMADTPLQS